MSFFSTGFGGVLRRFARLRSATQTYSDVVLADNPTAYWKLDETSGTTAVNEIGSGDGTYENSPTLGQSSLIQSGQAVLFDGTDDQVSTNYTPSFTAGSIETWIQTTNTGSGNTVAVGVGESGGNGESIQLQVRDGGYASVGVGGGYALSNIFVADGNSHHYVAIFAPGTLGSDINLYVDGVQASLTSTSATDSKSIGVTNTSPVSIGAFLSANPEFHNHFDGLVDEVAIYDYALTSSQISEHYALGKGITDSYGQAVIADTPVAYWRLDDSVGSSTATDSVGSYTFTGYNVYSFNQAPLIMAGSAVTIDQTSQGYFEYRNTPPVGATLPYTLESWIHVPSNMADSDSFHLLILSNSGVTDTTQGMQVWNNGLLRIHSRSEDENAPFESASGTTDIRDGNPHHIVMRCQASGFDLFVDGTLEATLLSNLFPLNTADRISLGRYGDSSPTYGTISGEVDEVAVYDYALTAEQIAEHYAYGKGVTDTYGLEVIKDLPLAYWRCHDDSPPIQDMMNRYEGTELAPPTQYGVDNILSTNTGSSIQVNDSAWDISAMGQSITSSTITIEVWISNLNNNNDLSYLLDSNNRHIFAVAGNNTPSTIAYFDTTAWLNSSTVAPTDSNPHHYVWVINDTTAEIYLDGVKILNTTVTSNDFSTESEWILANHESLGDGSDPSGGGWSGNMQEFAVYDHTLSHTQIYEHYHVGVDANFDYELSVIQSEPLSFWEMDDINGPVTDTMGVGDLTVTGSPNYQITGKFNYAIELPTVSDKLESNSQNWTTCSIAFWARYPNTGGIYVGYGTGTEGFEIRSYDGDSELADVGLNVYTGSNNETTRVTNVNDDVWRFYVGTYDGSTGNFYVDGSFIDSVSASGGGTGPLHINITRWESEFFGDGVYDAIAVYDRVLTDTEITDLYNKGIGS